MLIASMSLALDDDLMLETVEAAFQQFNAFLDLHTKEKYMYVG